MKETHVKLLVQRNSYLRKVVDLESLASQEPVRGLSFCIAVSLSLFPLALPEHLTMLFLFRTLIFLNRCAERPELICRGL